MTPQVNPNSNTALKNSTEVQCEECQNSSFQEVLKIRKISKLLTGAPKDSYMPIPTFQCSKCGHINTEFLPQI